MGRHRRASAATHDPGSPTTDSTTVPAPRARHRGRPRGGRAPAPLRTGLLSVSAVMAMGTVAAASGLLPAPDGMYVEGFHGPGDRVPVDGLPVPSGPGAPGRANTPGADTVRPTDPAWRGADRPPATSPSPDRSGPAPARPDGDAPSDRQPDVTATDDERTDSRTDASSPPGQSAPAPGGATSTSPSAPPDRVNRAESAEAEVVRLVNRERARVGCRPLDADTELARLAGSHSRKMALEDFFSHIAPDGSTPWDRAAARGIENLAAENIARGQRDATTVVESWMASSQHRANILDCDYTTLGVGVHFGPGGPWWTQNFGY